LVYFLWLVHTADADEEDKTVLSCRVGCVKKPLENIVHPLQLMDLLSIMLYQFDI